MSRLYVCVVIAGAALLVNTASAASLATPATKITYKAPYGGISGTGFGGVSSGCGLAATLLVYPFFNLTTGVGTESDKVTAHSCGTANGTLSLDSSTGLNGTTFTTTTGLHHFVANWVLTFSVDLVATPGGASQSALAYYIVLGGLNVFDTTNNMTYRAGQADVPGLTHYITSGTYTRTFTKVHETTYLNVSLVSGHMFRMQVGVAVVLYLSVSPGSSSASATVNLGSGGKHGVLTSFTRD